MSSHKASVTDARWTVKHGCCVDKKCTPNTCMELPAGKTCGDCYHVARCTAIFGHTARDKYCDWFPRRFKEVRGALPNVTPDRTATR